MSERHQKAVTFLAYVGTWGVLISVDFGISQIPAPTNDYLAVVIAVIIVAVMFWAYQGERIAKGSTLPRLLRGTQVLLVLSCFLEGMSTYNLYFLGYLAGSYSHVVVLVKVLPNLLVNGLYLIYLGIMMSLTGMAISTFGLVAIAYRRGLNRTTTNTV